MTSTTGKMTPEKFLDLCDGMLRDLDVLARNAQGNDPLTVLVAVRIKAHIRMLYGWALSQQPPARVGSRHPNGQAVLAAIAAG